MSEAEDTFISHLIEMRDRLLRAVLAVVLVFICLFPWAKDIYGLLAQPLLAALPKGGQMIATEITTPFFVPMKVTMMAAFLLTLPWVFYQAWAFVAPGLYQHEKRLGVPLVIASVMQPWRLPSSSTLTISGDWPDCEIPTTRAFFNFGGRL